MLLDLIQTLTRAARAGLGHAQRREVCPPPLHTSSRWQALASWLSEQALGEPSGNAAARAAEDAGRPADRRRLLRAQRAFSQQLADLGSVASGALHACVWRARSVHELWHLRAQLYHLVALQRGQRDAELRLASLDRHFPTRRHRHGPRSAPGAAPAADPAAYTKPKH